MGTFSRGPIVVTDNIFVIDGVDLSDFFVVEELSDQLVPERNISLINGIQGRIGAYYSGASYGTRKIRFKIRFIEDTAEESYAKAVLVNNMYFSTNKLVKLEFKYRPGYYTNVILEGGVVLYKEDFTTSCILEFVAPEPIYYSNQLRTKTATGASGTIEMEPWSYNLIESVEIKTTTGVASDLLKYTIGDDSVYIRGLTVGTIYSILVENRRLYVSGVDKTAEHIGIDTDFIDIVRPSKSKLTWTGFPATATITLKYREAQL